MVLTVSFVLSPVTGLSCHRRLQDHRLDRLDTSVGMSGPHDFAVRIDARRLRASIRPSHPAPNVRDDREAPLLEERGIGGIVPVILGRDQLGQTATNWHDGQISCGDRNRVK